MISETHPQTEKLKAEKAREVQLQRDIKSGGAALAPPGPPGHPPPPSPPLEDQPKPSAEDVPPPSKTRPPPPKEPITTDNYNAMSEGVKQLVMKKTSTESGLTAGATIGEGDIRVCDWCGRRCKGPKGLSGHKGKCTVRIKVGRGWTQARTPPSLSLPPALTHTYFLPITR